MHSVEAGLGKAGHPAKARSRTLQPRWKREERRKEGRKDQSTLDSPIDCDKFQKKRDEEPGENRGRVRILSYGETPFGVREGHAGSETSKNGEILRIIFPSN